MKKVIWLLPFHLHLNPTFYQTLTVEDEIIFTESEDWMKTFNYHKKRLVMLLSAQRHFAAALKKSGFKVTTYEGSFKDALANYQDVSFITFEITDKGLHKKVLAAFESTLQPFEIRSTPSFLLTQDDLHRFLKRPFKMDGFYRLIRHHFKILMDKDKPVGGQYSYDALNRQKLPKGVHIEPPLHFTPDALTLKTMADIEALNDHPGSVDGFKAPVTHQEANALFDHFLNHRLHTFGPYQDALVSKNHEVSHSLISQALNIGLLDPLEVIQKAEAMLQENVLLASVEGFIRQIIWREYIRGIYLSMEDEYDESNFFDHQNPLPHYYWDADTKMACVKDSVTGVIHDAYAHHIERLMVLGNFANLAGVNPKEVNDWFNIMFIDSHDWVVTPNVIGMALFADGGKMATKPYISSGAYIHKMGDHCDSCYYDVKQKTGEKACPFNALYWDYIDRHQEKLATNPRMGIPLSTLNKMSPDNKDALLTQAKIWLSHLESL
jgi:deoxyribodipyrimidine photolyase-related protein